MQDLNINQLAAIKGKKFTRREMDIIACLLCGRAATIPSFLSISSRTVETHVHNIMLKLECNSREGIIDFIEQSDKLPFVKAHYKNLSIDVLFEKCLKEIANITRNKTGLCTIWYEPNVPLSHMDIIHKLIKHIKMAGIETTLKRKNDPESLNFDVSTDQTQSNLRQYSLSVLSEEEYEALYLIDDLEISGQEDCGPEDSHFIRLDRWANDALLQNSNTKKTNIYAFSDYYTGVLNILRTIYPEHDFEKKINDFNVQRTSLSHGEVAIAHGYELYEQPENTKLKSKSNGAKSYSLRSSMLSLFNYKSAHIIFFSIVVFCALFLFSGHKRDEVEDYGTNRYIRSDLPIPAESVLLGRATLLRKMKNYFSEHATNKSIIKVIGLVGIGGSGKTTLARAFAKTFNNSPVVWEINAETRNSIIDSFKNLAYALAQTKESKSELSNIQRIQNVDKMEKRIVMFVAKYLQRCPNWVLIYDNVESFSDLEHFFPHDADRYGSGKVIITTRDQSGGHSEYLDVDSIIQVNALSASEALALFTKMTYNTEAYVFSREKEKKLIHFLSNIPPYPLDVAVASYYIKNSDITCETYLERMKGNTKDFERAQHLFLKNSSAYSKTRYNIITLSIKRLIDAEPEFKDLLLLLSFVAAEDIPKALFEIYKNPVLIDRFIFALKKSAFITGKGLSKHDSNATFSIHRSTQKIMRDYLLRTNEKGYTGKTIHAFTHLIQNFSETYVLQKPGTTLNLVTHIIEFIQNSDNVTFKENNKEKIKQDLYYALGYAYKRFSRNLLLEKECFIKAYASQAQTHHIPNYKLAVMLNELSSICVDLSHNDDAILYAQKSLDLCKTLPDKALTSADCLRVIGLAYLLKNDFDNAKLHFNKGIYLLSSLDVSVRREAEASIYAILGWLYSVTYINGERAEEGIAYGHKAVSIMNAERQLYTKTPLKEKPEKISCEVARAKASLADVYCHLGDYKKAYELGYRDVQYIIDNHLDTCSHYLLKIYMAIGMGEIHLREKRLLEAKTTLAKVIKDAENVMGATNMLLLSPRVFSAETHIRLNELDAAYNDCLAAFKIEQKECTNYSKLILATAYYHAGIIKYKQGDFEKSFEYFKSFFEHIKTASKSILDKGLYKALEEQGVFDARHTALNDMHYDAIRHYFKQATTIFKAIYGDNHAFVKNYVEHFS